MLGSSGSVGAVAVDGNAGGGSQPWRIGIYTIAVEVPTHCKLGNNGTTSVFASSYTEVDLNERAFDLNQDGDPSNSKVIVPRHGVYRVSGYLNFSSTDDTSSFYIRLYNKTQDKQYFSSTIGHADSGIGTNIRASVSDVFNAIDEVELYSYQRTGRSVGVGDASLEVERIDT